MRELPAGTVTFLFTDVEGSTRLLQELGDDYFAPELNQISDPEFERGRDEGSRLLLDEAYAQALAE